MGIVSFYHDEPLFGLDIGHSNLKVMQIQLEDGKKPRVLGYGSGDYPSAAIAANGVITDNAVLNKSLYSVLSEHLVGSISTRRVACTVPTSRTFSRPMKLPPMTDAEVMEAVHLEAEQYIPIPPANLYIGYDVVHRSEQGIELLVVASPKNIIDSYMKFLESVGLEPVALEPTMNASSRLFASVDPSHQPSILLDIGSVAVDIAVFDQTMFVNNTIQGGSDNITNLISKHLNIGPDEAYKIKNRFGISVSEHRQQVLEAVGPVLENLLREIKKIIRYYDEHRSNPQKKIVQIVTIGGGANMPGLNEYLSGELHLPTKMLSPWEAIDFGHLNPPDPINRSMYLTVAGAAMLNPKEIFA